MVPDHKHKLGWYRRHSLSLLCLTGRLISFCSHVFSKKILRIFSLCCVWVGLLEPFSRRSMEKDIISSSNKDQRQLTHPWFLPSAAELHSCAWYKGKGCCCFLLPMLCNHPPFRGTKPRVPGPCWGMKKTLSADYLRINFSVTVSSEEAANQMTNTAPVA